MAGALVLVAAAPSPLSASQPGLTQQQQIAILRALIAEVGIARQPLPPDKHGVVLSSQGQILNAGSVQSALEDGNPAAKVGALVAITNITFKDTRIIFDINGGPHTTHWYNHVHIGLGSSMPTGSAPMGTGARGAVITLRFPQEVPALSPEQVKQYLSPLIDWDRPSKAEVMVQPIPAIAKEAIRNHQVLVGMTRQMVVASLGRTGNKTGSTDKQGRQVQDWVYGNPPDTTFVRFYNGRVLRVTIWKQGVETVSTQAPPALAAAAQQQQEQATTLEQEASQPAPTLRRPGDAPVPKAKPGSAPGPVMIPPPMSTTPPTSGNQQTPPVQQQGPPVLCCGQRG